MAGCLKNRYIRISVLMAADAMVITLSLLLAFWLRFDFGEGYRMYSAYAYRLHMLPWLIGVRWLCGWAANIYRWSFSHSSLTEGVNLSLSVFAGTVLFIALGHGLSAFPYPPPRSIYALEAAFTLGGLVFIRFFPKYAFLLYRIHYHDKGVDDPGKTAVIFGAGGNAELLARDLARTSGHGYNLAGFIDDDKGKWGSRIHGLKVLGGIDDLPAVIDRFDVEEILVAIPDFSGPRLQRLVEICGPKKVKFKVIPSYPSILEKNKGKLLEDIKPEALLERKLVEFDHLKVNRLLAGKTILVTGAAGSIGSELCRQTAAQGIGKLVLFDLNENELYFLVSDLREKHPELDINLEVGSVRDRPRLDALMKQHRPNLVFHAAAHKHVPLMEYSPAEAIKNNVIGTFETAESALRHGVERFTLVSTDKAVASANIMGASKALAEFIVRSLNERNGMRCSAVRFGNVLGSNGSLLQIIRRQIAAGGPVTVTHKDMTRFFMAIPEAVALILMAAALDEGETYILDMGDPIKVDRLIRQVVMLSGLTPDADIEIRYTRPRPGEKLYEELQAGGETLAKSSFSRIGVVTGRENDDRELEPMLVEARLAALENSHEQARAFFIKWVPDFNPPAE